MKKVKYYLLGLAILTLVLMSLHLKGLFGAALAEKDKIDQQIASVVCNSFADISTVQDVQDCSNLGNGSFQLVANPDNDLLNNLLSQQMEDEIPFSFQISLKHSIGPIDGIESNLEIEDSFQTALVHVDVPPLRNVILTGWGTEFAMILIICSTMIWIYYKIMDVLKKFKSYSSSAELDKIQIGKYSFDVLNQALSLNDKHWRITAKECQVLKYLCSSRNQITRRDDILTALWGENDYFKGRSLDVFISRLRKYLSEDEAIRIETVHGVGFILIDK